MTNANVVVVEDDNHSFAICLWQMANTSHSPQANALAPMAKPSLRLCIGHFAFALKSAKLKLPLGKNGV